MNEETKDTQTQQPTPQPDVIYANLSGDQEPTVMESICVNCFKQGTTTLLLTRIPFFKDVILMSFYCDECGYKNNEIQTGEIQEKGVLIKSRYTNKKDLNRDLVKSEHCTVRIPELDFELSPSAKKAVVNTVEGLLQNFIDGLEQDQEERRRVVPEVAVQVEGIISKLAKMKDGEGFPFTFIFDDPSGNSFIKNPYAPSSDPEMKIEHYLATREQLEAMGYNPENAIEERKTMDSDHKLKIDQAHKMLDFTAPLDENEDLKGEALCFPTPCHACQEMGENKMCTVTIPYFKELIIMAFVCEKCGAKSREVKTGGETSAQGKCITLKVENEDDLQRDVFKSDSSLLKIPELELELLAGTLGGVFTTVEGLLVQIHDHLKENNPFSGDSADTTFRENMFRVLDTLKGYSEFRNKEKFTIILDDPLANCFILNPNYPKEDPQIEVHVYDRTFEQNEELGLNDINTENYQTQ